MIRKKDKDLSSGQTVVNTKVAGKTENNMVLVLTHQPVERLSKESGKKERDCTGFQTNDQVCTILKLNLNLRIIIYSINIY